MANSFPNRLKERLQNNCNKYFIYFQVTVDTEKQSLIDRQTNKPDQLQYTRPPLFERGKHIYGSYCQ